MKFELLYYLLQIILFILIYYLYNRYKRRIYSKYNSQKYNKGVQSMMPKDPKIANNQTNHEPPILTSNTNKELKKKIKDISLQVLKRNYELYKALENK